MYRRCPAPAEEWSGPASPGECPLASCPGRKARCTARRGARQGAPPGPQDPRVAPRPQNTWGPRHAAEGARRAVAVAPPPRLLAAGSRAEPLPCRGGAGRRRRCLWGRPRPGAPPLAARRASARRARRQWWRRPPRRRPGRPTGRRRGIGGPAAATLPGRSRRPRTSAAGSGSWVRSCASSPGPRRAPAAAARPRSAPPPTAGSPPSRSR
mmetsp:Transcript_2407/g.7704  ORF Transcript_2407/g.7704 Transcript_2407/m.7704 type:complete len:210 (-) Transcript_2407:151-780(-)